MEYVQLEQFVNLLCAFVAVYMIDYKNNAWNE